MSRDLIKLDLSKNNKSGAKTKESYIKKHYPDDYNKIIKIIDVENWYEKLYWYVNLIEFKPVCRNKCCKNHTIFKGYSKGYYGYCSTICKNSDIDFINKIKNINISKYGVDNPMKLAENTIKAKHTKKEKYGSEKYCNVDKAKKTKLKVYGDENYNNREKAVKTTVKKYGVNNYGNRKKAVETTIKRYGVTYYSQTNDFKKRIKEYHQNIDDVQKESILDKRKKTNKERYNCESFAQTPKYRIELTKKLISKKSIALGIDEKNITYDLPVQLFTIKNYCKKHSEFNINYHVLKNRILYKISDICTICNPVSSNSSICEKEMCDFISNETGLLCNKHKINNKEIDIYLPEHKLGIEFDGLYWHSNIRCDMNYHLNKTNMCEKEDIQLLHVFEHEWKMKKEIVKSIIKSKLNIINNKIFARKCNIKEIDSKTSAEFLNENHIQGNINSKVKIGLFYNEELVSIMTFGKKRIALGNKTTIDGEYEMLRFCNKLNTQVIGGAGKLLNYFIKTYSPKSILTFADRRYSNGSLYRKLGFEFIGNTKPNYWYFKPHEYVLHHRFKFRKNVLVKEGYDPNKTEHEIMAERGYMRIYDCGSIKYIMNIN